MTSPPEPQAPASGPRRIAAIVLAAGRSQRMQPINKLLVEIEGTPLVARVVDRVLAAGADHVVVVTGHQAEQVAAALASSGVAIVHNPDFAQGLSSSLRCGLRALGNGFDGAMVCLADMPRVEREHMQVLMSAFDR
ncbi:MAG: NTP transferase domain-containing protein, partial [Polyangiales bacterium]